MQKVSQFKQLEKMKLIEERRKHYEEQVIKNNIREKY
jgi:hypothetical protein